MRTPGKGSWTAASGLQATAEAVNESEPVRQNTAATRTRAWNHAYILHSLFTVGKFSLKIQIVKIITFLLTNYPPPRLQPDIYARGVAAAYIS